MSILCNILPPLQPFSYFLFSPSWLLENPAACGSLLQKIRANWWDVATAHTSPAGSAALEEK